MTKCPVFTFDFQTKQTLELVYGSDYEKQLTLFEGDEQGRLQTLPNRKSGSNWDDQIGGIRNSSSEVKFDQNGNNLNSSAKSLRFSLIKTSKPVGDFWKILKSYINKNFLILAVARDENDKKKEGFGYPLIQIQEIDSVRLIGKFIFQI